MPFEEAVWTEPLSCVVNSTDRLAIQPGQTAVVIGAGPIGALHGMMFAAAGGHVIIADLRLEVAAAAGLHTTVDAHSESLRECVMDLTNGLGAEVVVDAVGNQFGAVLELAAMEASIALFGLNERALPTVRQWDITRKQLTIFGSFVGAATFPRAIQILESGSLKPSVLNTMTLPLPEMLSGIEAARRGEAVKVLVLPE